MGSRCGRTATRSTVGARSGDRSAGSPREPRRRERFARCGSARPGGGRATTTLAEFVDECLEMHQAASVTIAKLRWLLGKSTSEFGEKLLAELSPQDIFGWRLTVPDHNPAKLGVPDPQRRAKEKRSFESWRQVEAAAAKLGPVYGRMVIFAAATGLQPSEPFGLDQRGVDRAGTRRQG